MIGAVLPAEVGSVALLPSSSSDSVPSGSADGNESWFSTILSHVKKRLHSHLIVHYNGRKVGTSDLKCNIVDTIIRDIPVK